MHETVFTCICDLHTTFFQSEAALAVARSSPAAGAEAARDGTVRPARAASTSVRGEARNIYACLIVSDAHGTLAAAANRREERASFSPLSHMNVLRLSVARLATGRSMLVSARSLSTGAPRLGLEEFFPANVNSKDNYGVWNNRGFIFSRVDGDLTIVGRAWAARDLRHKSFDDLHKLWFVLLKEKNMLLTVKHDAKRTGSTMPAKDRLRKVRNGMAAIKTVIGERDRAVAEYNAEKGIPAVC